MLRVAFFKKNECNTMEYDCCPSGTQKLHFIEVEKKSNIQIYGKIKWKVRLKLAWDDKGSYLIGKMEELVDGRFIERADKERILKISKMYDDETLERLKEITNNHRKEIVDMFFNGRLYMARKFF